MVEETVCLQCGDRGFENAFVYCVSCVEFAVHRYCLDEIPDTLDEIVLWLCDECKVKGQKQPIVLKHDAIPSQTSHHEVSNIKGCLENGILDGKNDENGILLSADASKRSEQSSSSQQLEEENVDGNLMEPIELADGGLKQKKRRKRNVIEPSAEKDKHRLATTSYRESVEVDINKCKASLSEVIELSTGCMEQKKTEIENKKKRKRKKKRSVVESVTETDQHILPLTTSCNEHVEVDINKCKRLESELIELPAGCVEQKETEIKNEKKKRRKKRNVVESTMEEDQHRLPTSYNEVVEVDTNGCTRLASDPVELEQNETEIKKKRKKKKRKRDVMESTTEKHQHKLATTSCDVRVKVDINDCTRLASKLIELSADCVEQNNTVIKKKRRKKKKRNAMESTMEEDQHRLTTPSCNEVVKVDTGECPSLASDPVELEQKTTEIKKKRKKKRKTDITESTTENDQHRLAMTLPSEVRDDEQKDQIRISNPLRSITDMGIADQPLFSNNGPSKTVKKKKTTMQEHVHQSGVPQLLESKDNHLENEFTDLSIVRRGLSSSNDPIENRGPQNKEERTSTSCQRKSASKYYPQDLGFMVAEPVAIPIWRGSFDIREEEYDKIDELMAHISSKACHKVYETASRFQPVLHLKMFPKSDIWPKSFMTEQPNGDSIALYFFPSKISEQVFDQLVEEMIHKELAFKACMHNIELLIFTSTELPLRYWRFGRKYYLWGVFREKQTLPSSTTLSSSVVGAPLMREKCDDRSPISPLSNSATSGSLGQSQEC